MKAALGIVSMLLVAAFALHTAPGSAEPLGSAYDADFESFDGTKIAITVFPPREGSADAPVPVIVRSHGWSGSREKNETPTVKAFLDAGYGVVTFDARGHGASGGLARVHDPDYEIRDVSLLFDWIHDNLAWVEKETGSDRAKDIVAGGSGYSYGGGWQLLFAEHDGRIDALQPDITWNSLPQALVPNGAANSGWVNLLYASGKARARIDPMIDAWYAEIMATNRAPPEAIAHFERSSVYPLVDRITQPTLLTQGVPDTLFNLNQAVATFEAIRANGAEVRLLTHLNGHLLNPSVVDARLPDVPFPQPGNRGSPCGDLEAAAVRWFDRHLRGRLDVADFAPVSFAMEDGTCLRVATLPEPDAVRVAASALALPSHVGSVVLPLLESDGTTRLAGIPRLTIARATVVGVDDTLYASLLVLPSDGRAPRVVDAQVTPLRLAGPATATVEMDLGGIATVLEPGDRLALKLDRVNEFYATNSGRLPSALVLEDVRVGLPVVG